MGVVFIKLNKYTDLNQSLIIWYFFLAKTEGIMPNHNPKRVILFYMKYLLKNNW